MLDAIQASNLLPGRLRALILRAMGLTVVDQVFVAHRVSFAGGDVLLDRRVFINAHAVLDATAPIVLEPDAYVAHGAMLVTATYAVGPSAARAGAAAARPIRVGAGTWIGARAVILPGVTITEPDGLYAGSPARRMRTLDLDAARPAP